MTDGEIRPRTDDDLAACAEVLVEVHGVDGYPVEGVADPVAWLTPPALLHAWVATLDHHPVGHVALSEPQPGDDAAHLWHEQSGEPLHQLGVLGRLFVSPSARGHAFGRRLVEAVAAECDRISRRPVLDVMAKDSAAIHLYERLGWHRIGSTTHRFGDHQTTDAYCYVLTR